MCFDINFYHTVQEDISGRGQEDARMCGLSWVEPETYKPFTKYR
jgi:hypothetical protein